MDSFWSSRPLLWPGPAERLLGRRHQLRRGGRRISEEGRYGVQLSMISGSRPAVSRRQFLSGCAVMASLHVTRAFGQDGREAAPELKLVHDFKNAMLHAVSPDGKRLCLYFSRNPHDTFNWSRGGPWKQQKRA